MIKTQSFTFSTQNLQFYNLKILFSVSDGHDEHAGFERSFSVRGFETHLTSGRGQHAATSTTTTTFASGQTTTTSSKTFAATRNINKNTSKTITIINTTMSFSKT